MAAEASSRASRSDAALAAASDAAASDAAASARAPEKERSSASAASTAATRSESCRSSSTRSAANASVRDSMSAFFSASSLLAVSRLRLNRVDELLGLRVERLQGIRAARLLQGLASLRLQRPQRVARRGRLTRQRRHRRAKRVALLHERVRRAVGRAGRAGTGTGTRRGRLLRLGQRGFRGGQVAREARRLLVARLQRRVRLLLRRLYRLALLHRAAGLLARRPPPPRRPAASRAPLPRALQPSRARPLRGGELRLELRRGLLRLAARCRGVRLGRRASEVSSSASLSASRVSAACFSFCRPLPFSIAFLSLSFTGGAPPPPPTPPPTREAASAAAVASASLVSRPRQLLAQAGRLGVGLLEVIPHGAHGALGGGQWRIPSRGMTSRASPHERVARVSKLSLPLREPRLRRLLLLLQALALLDRLLELVLHGGHLRRRRLRRRRAIRLRRRGGLRQLGLQAAQLLAQAGRLGVGLLEVIPHGAHGALGGGGGFRLEG